MNYTKVDLNEWKRGELFSFCINQKRIVVSMTVDINVTRLATFARQRGLEFYPCMLWVVSKVINAHDEFKYSWDGDGNLIRWDYVSPSYADYHPDNECFTKLVTEFSDDIDTFHSRFMADRENNKDLRGIAGNQPKNNFDVSCLPWVRYSNFDVHVFDDGKLLAPVVTWGKYEEECKGTIMPLTMNINHAVADGFHVARFFNEIQELINEFGSF